MDKILLSVIISLRNDEYYPDIFYRIQKTLDLNTFFLSRLDYHKNIEFIFVDWGSEDKVVKYITSNFLYKNNIKFIHVKKDIADRFSKNYFSSFNFEMSNNLGARQSNGKYLLFFGMDNFFENNSWFNLFNYINLNSPLDKKLIFIPRKIIDYEIYRKNPDNYFYDYYLNNLNHSYYYSKANQFYIGGGFNMLISKENYNFLGGANESYKKSLAADVDWTIRSGMENFQKINGSLLGLASYKMPPLKKSNRTLFVKDKKNPRNILIIPKKYFMNSEDWGMINEKIDSDNVEKISDNFENSCNLIKSIEKNKKIKLFKNSFKNLRVLNYKMNFHSFKYFLILKNLIQNLNFFSLISINNNCINKEITISNFFKSLSILLVSRNDETSIKKLKNIGSLSQKRHGIFDFILNDEPTIALKKINFFCKENQDNLMLIDLCENKIIYKILDFLKKNISNYQNYYSIIILQNNLQLFSDYQNYFESYYKFIKIDNNFIILISKKILPTIILDRELNKKKLLIFYFIYKLLFFFKSFLNKLRIKYYDI